MALDLTPRWAVVLGCVATALVLRTVFALAYRDQDRILRTVGLIEGPRAEYYAKRDPFLAPLPFVWTWAEILAISTAAAGARNLAADLIAAVLIAGRFRALQEIGHIAVHYGLCRSRGLQERVTNAFFQFPLMKRSFRSRRRIHCLEHHRSPNTPGKDPNLARLVEAGMVPGLTPRAFWLKLFYPLTPLGVRTTIGAMRSGVMETASGSERLERVAAVAATLMVFYAAGGASGVLIHYLLPLTLLYPWFSWLSLLTEHRWFAEVDHTDRVAMECSACRPTRFRGLGGAMVGLLLMPYSDRYHLAHSLYPYLRWSHLPAVDRRLSQTEPRYERYASQGLLFASRNAPAALSELRDRLCGRRQDLAAWARTPAAAVESP